MAICDIFTKVLLYETKFKILIRVIRMGFLTLNKIHFKTN